MTHWQTIPSDSAAQRRLAAAIGCHPVTAQILLHRGCAAPEAAARFLAPRVHDLYDPFRLPDMETAVDRIAAAVARGERIALFGDYDADGVTGTALAWHFFRAIGVAVDYVIPHRVRDGYGLTTAAVERCADGEPPDGSGARSKPDLLITIDNGTTAVAAVDRARALGLDVVITDHHEVVGDLPAACAVVNPHRRDVAEPYPFPGLCGVGVVFKLCTALRHRLRATGHFAGRPEPNLAQWLDLTAVGTIADVVPLRDENRIFAAVGLRAVNRGANPGLRALCGIAGVDPGRCAARTVAFQIAPRLNAAGRMADARLAVDLLTTDDPGRAAELAAQLDALNAERQSMEEGIRCAAEALLRAEPADRVSFVAAASDWSAGVVGIVAGRIAAKSRRPTVLISTQGDLGIGSARGIGDFPLLEALTECAPHLIRFGGHAKAAGVTVTPEQIPVFREAFEAAVRMRLRPEHRDPPLRIDAEVRPEEVTKELVAELQQLAPFGEGNPEPVLCVRQMGVRSRRVVGNNHLKLTVNGGLITFEAIGFTLGLHPDQAADRLDLAFTPEPNEWNGRTSIQLKLLDLKGINRN